MLSSSTVTAAGSRPAPAFARLRAPLLWLLLPVLAGYAAGLQMSAAWSRWLLIPALVSTFGGLAAVARGRRNGLLLSSAAVALAAPAWLACLRDHPAPEASQPPREVAVRVRVTAVLAGASSEDRAAGFGIVTEADAHVRRLLGRRVFFNAERTPAGLEWTPSMEVGLRGVLRALDPNPDPGGFDTYLVSSGATHRLERCRLTGAVTPPTAARRFLHAAFHRMEAILGLGLEDKPDRRALYAALKLGAKADLSEEDRLAYRRTGTLHLFAISGMNIGLIAAASCFLFRVLWLPAPLATIGGVLVSGFFVLATGTTPSAVRALLMVTCACLARLCWRSTNPLASWTFPALVVLLVDPAALLSPGFQLSYSVVLGLILYSGPVTEFLRRIPPLAVRPAFTATARWARLWSKALAFVLEGLAVSGAALLASLPTSLSCFGAVSPGALLANLILVPLASLVVLIGLGSLVLGLAGLDAGAAACNRLAVLALDLMDLAANAVATLPGIQWTGAWRWPYAGLLSAMLILGSLGLGASRGWKPAGWLLVPPALALLLLPLATLTPG